MSDDFGICLRRERPPLRRERQPQCLKILDNAIVDYSDPGGRVWVRVVFRRRTMGCPTGMADTHRSPYRVGLYQALQIDELAFRPPPVDMTVDQGRDAGRVVAAILKPLQCLHQMGCHRPVSDNANNAAHRLNLSQTDKLSNQSYSAARRAFTRSLAALNRSAHSAF